MISSAKINFGLKVLHKRPDGYHDIESIFIKLNWGDKIEFYPNEFGIIRLFSINEIQTSSRDLFEEVSERGDFKKNILYKVFEKSKSIIPEMPGVDVHLTKCIPPGGGLGGGSSNAAKLLNYLFYNTNRDLTDEFFNLAKEIGADVPFFLEEKSSHISGIGDIISPILISNGLGILVIPEVSISTKDSYSSMKKPLQLHYGVKTWNFLEEDFFFHFQNANWSYFKNKFTNDFEEFAFKTYPFLEVLKQDLYKAGCSFASMSGSGSCFYGLVNDLDTQLEVVHSLQKKYPNYSILRFNF